MADGTIRSYQDIVRAFVRLAKGHKSTSKQVTAGLGGAIVGAVLVANIVENPKAIKPLSGAVIIAGIAIYAVRVGDEKIQDA